MKGISFFEHFDMSERLCRQRTILLLLIAYALCIDAKAIDIPMIATDRANNIIIVIM
jgi:hypothetical protein